MSGCIQGEHSKVIILLLTSNNIVEIFEKTLAGSFSSVNTRLAFDTEILMPSISPDYYKKSNIDQSFKSLKRDGLKVLYRIKLDSNKKSHNRRIILKILKFDENNQYGFAMTKPLPT